MEWIQCNDLWCDGKKKKLYQESDIKKPVINIMEDSISNSNYKGKIPKINVARNIQSHMENMLKIY